MKFLLMSLLLVSVTACDLFNKPEEDGGTAVKTPGRCIDGATAIAEGFDLSKLDPKHKNCAPTSANPDKCFCVTDQACHTASKCPSN